MGKILNVDFLFSFLPLENAYGKLGKTKKLVPVNGADTDDESCKLFNYGNLEQNIVVVQCIKVCV